MEEKIKIKVERPAKLSKYIATILGEGEYYRKFIERTHGCIPASQVEHLRYMSRHIDGWKVKQKRVDRDMLRMRIGY